MGQKTEAGPIPFSKPKFVVLEHNIQKVGHNFYERREASIEHGKDPNDPVKLLMKITRSINGVEVISKVSKVVGEDDKKQEIITDLMIEELQDFYLMWGDNWTPKKPQDERGHTTPTMLDICR